GVCMANGEKDVMKIADVVADSNDDDGVAKIVEKYLLGE
ncbi:MAG: HAD hydrolase family protein, partial [Clostridia bacterium]|nr:HAD hydrolase family protein [Clostridia bacterium]